MYRQQQRDRGKKNKENFRELNRSYITDGQATGSGVDTLGCKSSLLYRTFISLKLIRVLHPRGKIIAKIRRETRISRQTMGRIIKEKLLS